MMSGMSGVSGMSWMSGVRAVSGVSAGSGVEWGGWVELVEGAKGATHHRINVGNSQHIFVA